MSTSSERVASPLRPPLDLWLWLLALQFLLSVLADLADTEWRLVLVQLRMGNVLAFIFMGLNWFCHCGGLALIPWQRRASLVWAQLALWLPLLLDIVLSLPLHLRSMVWWVMPLELIRYLALVMPAIGWTAFLNTSPRVAACYPRRREVTALFSAGSPPQPIVEMRWARAWWQRWTGIWSGDLARRMLIFYGLAMLGSLVLPRDYVGVMTWRWQGPPDSDLAMVLRDWQDLSQFVLPGLAALLLLFWRRWWSLRAVAACLWLVPLGRFLVVMPLDHRALVDVLAGAAIDRNAFLLAIAWSAYLFNAEHLRRLYPNGDGYNSQVTDVDVF